jgi:hypothetical protein
MVQKRWQLNNQGKHLCSTLDVRTSTPAWQSERTLHNLHLLASLTTPRVWAAVFSTIWNRWCTARRYQQRQSNKNRCVLGCSDTAEDSIEHYSRCPCTRELAARLLHLDPTTQVNMHAFNLCSSSITTQEELVASSVMIYAVYRATNYYRNHPDIRPNDIYNALRQWAREAAFNDTNTTRVLRNRWNPSFRPTPLPTRSSAVPPPAKSSSAKRKPAPTTNADKNVQKRARVATPTTMMTHRTEPTPAATNIQHTCRTRFVRAAELALQPNEYRYSDHTP